ncbi:MAG: ferrous iron transport protein B [Candidatus Eisenbacteria bacterium]|uniref:Ferrous iron transport protein B n=1 Tax=Eiseniibacteriota bacterium TaxID=2212470 RepID=A0A538SZB7_UNCEI|nr:MAG: ferrous iron transport protein B [Candidatus Eisenbacteria bacterium]
MSIPTDLAAVSPSTSDRARRQPEAHRRTRRKLVAIAGGPNCGKSTLFNRLTGLRQKVANYPGVTVEKKAGFCPLASGRTVEVLDLPGTYSLRPGSPDEVVVRDVLLGVQSDTPLPDLTLLVLDATCLERQLYLCMQLIEIGRPVVVALNMMDTADEEGLHVDAPLLERTFGAPVIPISAKTGSGLRELREAMEQDVAPPRPVTRTLAAPLLQAAQKVAGMLPSTGPLATLNRFHVAMALLLDEGEDDSLMRAVPPAIRREVLALRALLNAEIPEWRSHEPIGHYRSIEDLIRRATLRVKPETSVRERIDRVLTHRVFGPLIFIAFMAVIFQSLFMWAQPLMNAIDFGVSALGRFIGPWLPAGPIRSLVVDGAIAGVGAVVTFVPQIAFLFLFISLMEDSGYLARAAFIMDRLMRGVGLSGRAFIPLLSSFACAIPGIMATRTIDNRRDRLTTILIAPFMSCSARLPVYALLIGAFIPNRTVLGILNLPGLVLFCLYVLGILAAVVVAWALKRTALRGARPLYVMELPPYRVPSWRSVLVTVRDRAGLFVQKAGTVILAVSIVLWFLASYPKNAEVKPLEKELQKVEQSADQAQAQGQRAEAAASRAQAVHLENEIAGVSLRDSFAGRAGRLIEPAIAPLGFDWKIGIALLSSFAAREVMVSTMATVYNLGDADQTSVSLREKLRHAEDPRTGEKAYSPLMAVSLMVFFVLACQCMSTVAVVRRETNSWGWPIFMVVMMNALAWIASFAVFQGGRMLGLG